jgi:hypothetical protein
MQIHSVGIDLGKTTLSPCSSRHSRKGAAEEEVYSAAADHVHSQPRLEMRTGSLRILNAAKSESSRSIGTWR